MNRALSILALLGLLAPAGAAATPERDAHRHPGQLFQFRFETPMSDAFIYRAFLDDPGRPERLIIERGNGNLGDEAMIDLTPATCPAAAAAVMRLASLPLPAVALSPPPAPAPAGDGPVARGTYYFSGVVQFPNGAEGEATFYAYEGGRGRVDPLLGWLRAVTGAVDRCRPRVRRD